MRNDLDAAAHNIERFPRVTIKLAQDAVHAGCMALMLAFGFRTNGSDHRKTAVEFALAALPDHAQLLQEADSLRRQRNTAAYSPGFYFEPSDADELLAIARRVADVLERAARERIAARGP